MLRPIKTWIHRDNPWRSLFGMAVIAFGYAQMRGLLSLHQVPDSKSYLEYSFQSWESVRNSIRTPGYPLWVALVSQSMGLSWLPWLQVALHTLAVWTLYCELKRWGTDGTASLLATLSILIGCTFSDHVHTLSTDLMAASLGVMTVVGIMQCVRSHYSTDKILWVGACILAAILVRPAYLFLVPWLFIVTPMLHWVHRESLAMPKSRIVFLFLMAVAPIACWVGLRGLVAGHLAIVPFGQLNLSGVLVQLVTVQELEELDPIARPFRSELMNQFEQLKQGPRPLSIGPSLSSVELDRQWHDVMYQWLSPVAERQNPDDSIAQHQSFGSLNRAIIKAYPLRYGVWLLKGIRQSTWTLCVDILMHPVFLGLVFLATFYELWRHLFRNSGFVREPSMGCRALAVISITYAMSNIILIVLTSPPIGRFTDAAAIFIPAWFVLAYCERAFFESAYGERRNVDACNIRRHESKAGRP